MLLLLLSLLENEMKSFQIASTKKMQKTSISTVSMKSQQLPWVAVVVPSLHLNCKHLTIPDTTSQAASYSVSQPAIIQPSKQPFIEDVKKVAKKQKKHFPSRCFPFLHYYWMFRYCNRKNADSGSERVAEIVLDCNNITG